MRSKRLRTAHTAGVRAVHDIPIIDRAALTDVSVTHHAANRNLRHIFAIACTPTGGERATSCIVTSDDSESLRNRLKKRSGAYFFCDKHGTARAP
jgi:hypothetical protein